MPREYDAGALRSTEGWARMHAFLVRNARVGVTGFCFRARRSLVAAVKSDFLQ